MIAGRDTERDKGRYLRLDRRQIIIIQSGAGLRNEISSSASGTQSDTSFVFHGQNGIS